MAVAPTCAGTYAEGEAVCDGEYKKEKPCAWKETCRQLRDFCRFTGLKTEALLEHSKEDLEKLAAKIIEAGTVTGMTKEALDKKPEPAKPTRSRRFSERMWRLHRHFENQLRDRFGEERVKNSMHEEKQDQVLGLPGSFFPVDRSESSGYVVWYCKTGDRYDKALAIVYFRPSLGCVDIHLPVSIGELEARFSKLTLQKLNPASVPDGWFKTLCRGLKEEGIGVAVGAIKKLVDLGDYPLPELY